MPTIDLTALAARIVMTKTVYVVGLGDVEAWCQYRPNAAAAQCGRPATVHRPEKLIVRFLCAECAHHTDPAARNGVAVDPGVVAIVERATQLDTEQRRRVHDAYRQNSNIHGRTQSALQRRVAEAGDVSEAYLRALNHRIVELFARMTADGRYPVGYDWAFTRAVEDAVYAHLAGEHLTADEARLFNAPWVDVAGPVEKPRPEMTHGDDLTPEQYKIADRIKTILEKAAPNGFSPSGIARRARTTTGEARTILRWMVDRQFVRSDDRGAWTHYYAGLAR